jgi:AcrR family transcriptional regulator
MHTGRGDKPFPDQPTAILAAARQALLTRGLGGVRVADIAELARVSSGSVHYHFETKDDVLVAAFQWSAQQLFRQVDERLHRTTSPTEQLGTLLGLSIPEAGLLRDEWVIWLQFWAQVLTQPALLEVCETVSQQWRSYFMDIVDAGVKAGDFHPVCPPDEVAERLIAMVDGLGFETVVGYRWTSPDRMRHLLSRFATEQVGVPIEVPVLSDVGL